MKDIYWNVIGLICIFLFAILFFGAVIFSELEKEKMEKHCDNVNSTKQCYEYCMKEARFSEQSCIELAQKLYIKKEYFVALTSALEGY